jgi:hypothetical protein
MILPLRKLLFKIGRWWCFIYHVNYHYRTSGLGHNFWLCSICRLPYTKADLAIYGKAGFTRIYYQGQELGR